MEHPLIGDTSSLSQEDLLTKISDLNKKLAIAQRSGNAHLCNQVRMALETFQTAYQQRLRDSQKNDPNAPNFDSIINIE
jgi:hypothetical protein